MKSKKKSEFLAVSYLPGSDDPGFFIPKYLYTKEKIMDMQKINGEWVLSQAPLDHDKYHSNRFERSQIRDKFDDVKEYLKEYDGICLTEDATRRLFHHWTTCTWYGPCNSDKDYHYIMPQMVKKGYARPTYESDGSTILYYTLHAKAKK